MDRSTAVRPLRAALCVRNLVKRYGTTTAVAGVDLDLEVGEFVVLLGANGAGKTTFLQLLTGLLAPDDGRIEIDGVDLTGNAPAALARLGVVFQDPAIDREMSVRDNLRFHARLFGLRRRDYRTRMEELLDFFGLTDRAAAPVRTLSGGLRRRVELARALLHQPSLLLMDEASAGLDPDARFRLIRHLRVRTQSESTAVLWATHLLDECGYADRVLHLEDGKLLAKPSGATG